MKPTVTIPPAVDLGAAEALLAELRKAFAQDPRCGIDASQVESLTLPGMQVILSALKTNPQARVLDPSAAFCTAFESAALSWENGEAESIEEPAPAPDAEPAPVEAAESEDVAAQTEDASAQSISTKRILTIDDSKTMRDMLRLTLAGAGFEVLQAVDGQDGLDVLTRERVDVVITDINMPKLDGYGVIRHLRADADYDNTPILVLSTESDQKTKDIGRDAGATGWLVKPFNPDQLVAIVRQVSP
jgi:two-component system chemotaxis response regulator CheY